MIEGTHRSTATTLQWPVQRKPDTNGWTLWRKALLCLCSRGRYLRIPLGQWYELDGTISYPWTIHRTTQQIHERYEEGYRIYNPKINRRHIIIQKDEFTHTNDTQTSELIPLPDMTFKNGLGKSTRADLTPQQEAPTTWNQSITDQSATFDETIYPTVIEQMPPSHIRIQMEQNLWVVTDGGVSDSTGYYGWVIATIDRILYEHNGQVMSDSKM